MWPFKKKEPKQPEPDWATVGIQELESFRKIGETFNYLGRTMIVTRNWRYELGIGVYPVLICDYADDRGVIHQASFRLGELPGLKAQNRTE